MNTGVKDEGRRRIGWSAAAGVGRRTPITVRGQRIDTCPNWGVNIPGREEYILELDYKKAQPKPDEEAAAPSSVGEAFQAAFNLQQAICEKDLTDESRATVGSQTHHICTAPATCPPRP